MGKLHRIINDISSDNKFSIYLSIFRVYLCFHILKKIFLVWGAISVIYGHGDGFGISETLPNIPFLTDFFINDVPLFIYLFVFLSFLWLFGIGRNVTCFLLFLCIRFTSQHNYLFSNGGDNLLYFLMFYMLLTDSYQYLVFTPFKSNSERIKKYVNLVSNLSSYSIAFHLCLAYFVSGFHKIHADVWYNGVATYYIWNLERYNAPINYLFSKNAIIIGFSTYFTILFEIFFPVLVWVKKMRLLLIVSGIFLHMGIYFSMMIYDFQILFIMIYGFYFSNDEIREMGNKLIKRFPVMVRVKNHFFTYNS
ncbi:MAG: hypothetical protein ACT4ON_10385 [Bacteroidota bacterium]